VIAPTVAAPAVPMRTPTRREAPPFGYGTPVAPTAVAPIPASAVTVTPGQEAGADVRAAASSSMTGGTAPQPPAGTTGGTPAKVPVFGSRTIGTSVTPPIPTFGRVAPDVAPSLPALPMPTASAAPGLSGTRNIGFEVAPAVRPAAPAAPAAPVPPPEEEDIFAGSSIKLEPEEVPSVEPRTDMAAMRARFDALRRMRAEREAAKQEALSSGVFSQ